MTKELKAKLIRKKSKKILKLYYKMKTEKVGNEPISAYTKTIRYALRLRYMVSEIYLIQSIQTGKNFPIGEVSFGVKDEFIFPNRIQA